MEYKNCKGRSNVTFDVNSINVHINVPIKLNKIGRFMGEKRGSSKLARAINNIQKISIFYAHSENKYIRKENE